MSEAARNAKAKDRRPISHRDFNRILFTVLAAGLAVLAILGGAIVWLAVKTSAYNQWIDHTYLAEQRIVSLADALDRRESVRRGYLIAPKPALLDSYRAARNNVDSRLYALALATQDNPVERTNLARMKPLLVWKNRLDEASIALVSTGHQQDAQNAFRDEQALKPMATLRQVTDAMYMEERRLLDDRMKQQREGTNLLAGVGLAAALLLAGLASTSVLVMRRFAEDLTRAEREVRALNQNLERRVEERTLDLTRANQEIQRFAYIVSHDLRSPLVNVMGFTSELEEAMKPIHSLIHSMDPAAAGGPSPLVIQAIDADIPEAISFIRSSTRKMDSLIGAILTLSRAGRRVLHPEQLPMDTLVDAMLATVKHRVASLGGEAIVDGDLPDIVSDRLAIEQVFGNLIDNAVKYHSPKRPLRIVVRGLQAKDQVVYEIEDNGRGVDPKDHDRIFDLFRRSGVQNQPGEGIGLAHVRALVQRLGGVITVRSALDHGAVFSVSLPKVLSPAEGIRS